MMMKFRLTNLVRALSLGIVLGSVHINTGCHPTIPDYCAPTWLSDLSATPDQSKPGELRFSAQVRVHWYANFCSADEALKMVTFGLLTFGHPLPPPFPGGVYNTTSIPQGTVIDGLVLAASTGGFLTKEIQFTIGNPPGPGSRPSNGWLGPLFNFLWNNIAGGFPWGGGLPGPGGQTGGGSQPGGGSGCGNNNSGGGGNNNNNCNCDCGSKAASKSGTGGDPVVVSTGEMLLDHVDFTYALPGEAFVLHRVYRSALRNEKGWFGKGFRSKYERSITRVQSAIIEIDSAGNEVHHFEDGAGGYLPDAITKARGHQEGTDRFVVEQTGGIRFTYDLFRGRLLSVRDRNGNGLDFLDPSPEGIPTRIVSTVGRNLLVEVDSELGVVSRLTLPDLSHWVYEYSASGELEVVRDPLNHENRYGYDPTRAGLMTSEANGNGETVQWVYGPDERVERVVNERGAATTIVYEETPLRKRHFTDSLGRTTSYTLDANGYMAEVAHSDGAVWKNQFSADGRVLSVEDPNQKVWSYSYGADGLLATAQGPGGEVQSWTRAPGTGFETSRTNEDGTVSAAVFSPKGDLTSLTDSSGKSFGQTFNTRGQILTRTDSSGTTTFEYNAFGDLVRTTDPLGRSTTRITDALGRVTSETDHLGHTTSREYWLHQVVKQETNALGHLRLTAVDGLLNPTVITDERGAVTRQTWASVNGTSHLVQKIDAEGHVWNYETDTEGREVAVTDPRLHTTRSFYDVRNRVVAVRDPLGHERHTLRNPNGTVHKEINELGFETTFLYDSSLRLERVVSPEGHVRRTRYNSRGQVVGQVDELGNETVMELDQEGRTLASIDAAGGRTEYTLDGRGQITRIKDPRGNETVFTLDALGRQVEIRDAGGGVRKQFFDEAGRLYRTLDPMNREHRFEFDDLGRIIREIGPEGQVTLRSYLPTGQVESETDPDGSTKSFAHDLLGRVVEEIDPLLHAVQRSYDSVGNLIRLTDQNGNSTTFGYDARNLLVSVTDAQGRVVSHTYDAARRRTSTTNARGQTTLFFYDSDSRMIERRTPEGSETFVYDEAGRRIRKTNGAVDEVVFYDPVGRETGRLDAGRGFAVGHLLDASGNPTLSTDSLGKTVSRSFDAVNRLSTLASQQGAGYALSYNLAGQVLQRSSEARGIETLTYDAAGRLKTLQVRKFSDQALVVGYEYFYSPAGDRVREIETRSGGIAVETIYEHNARHELTRALVTTPGGAAIKGFGEMVWTYDPAGNRLTQTKDGVAQILTFDTLNQIASIDGRAAQHDLDGNMTREPLDASKARIYEWDSQNRMTRTAVAHGAPGNEVLEDVFTYRYDADSMRVASIEEPDASAPTRPRNVEQRFVLGGQIAEDRRFVEGQEAAQLESRRFVRQGLQVLEEKRDSVAGAAITTGSTILYLQDALGSTVGQIESTPATPGTTAPTERVSVSVTGDQANGPTFDPDISGDGRFVAFLAFPQTNNLAPGDTNGLRDVYLKDRQTGAVERISAPSYAGQFDQGDGPVRISADGRFVLFQSFDYNPWPFVRSSLALRDRQLGTTTPLVSGSFGQADLSGDGRVLAFTSGNNHGVAQDQNGGGDVFVFDVQTSSFELISFGPASSGSNHGAFGVPAISEDGRFVAFTSGHQLVASDTDGFNDIYLKDRTTGTMVRVSVPNGGGQADSHSGNPAVSATGRWVAFTSTATNLVPGDSRFTDVFLKDMLTGTMERVSTGQGTNFSGEASFGPISISADGRYVTYTANDTAFQVPGPGNAADDIFLVTRDMLTRTTRQISLAPGGALSNGSSGAAAMSSDGRWITFSSVATNLVTSDTNGVQDIFLAQNPDLSTGGPATLGEAELLSYTPYGEQVAGPGARFTFTGLANEPLGGATDSMLAASYRSYRPGLGRWNQRDPAGAVDGPNLYRAMRGGPLRFFDPLGLLAFPIRTTTPGGAGISAGQLFAGVALHPRGGAQPFQGIGATLGGIGVGYIATNGSPINDLFNPIDECSRILSLVGVSVPSVLPILKLDVVVRAYIEPGRLGSDGLTFVHDIRSLTSILSTEEIAIASGALFASGGVYALLPLGARAEITAALRALAASASTLPPLLPPGSGP